MYESFFGLRKRPYAAAPDADILVETPAVSDAIERLDLCVRHGRGIGVLTAAAGMGKTHLCHSLVKRWEGEFRAVLLPNAGFPTRRGLLQSVLAELGRPYQRLGETESRLELTAAARAVRETLRGVVLLFDEAHRHSERILEEVRLVANLVDQGEPLFRVVLAGQVELEDRLASPELAALNERVGELVSLPRLTAEESRTYLRDRAAYGGGTLDGLFTPKATDLVVRACGGVPRCLNQLADHTLLLGYVAERRPADEALVREALDDLKRLPLHWHDPPQAVEPSATPETENRLAPIATERYDDVIEIGAGDDSGGFGHAASLHAPERETSGMADGDGPEASPGYGEFEVGSAASLKPFEAVVGLPEPVRATLPRAGMETIRDRFAQLDAADAAVRWAESLVRAEAATAAAAVRSEPARQITRAAADPLAILDRIDPLIAEALAAESAGTGMLASGGAAGGRPAVAVPRAAGPVAYVRTTGAAPATARVAARPSTLFSDLRRRRGGQR